MADLIFTARGTAEVLAAQERIAQATGKQKTAAAELRKEYAANDAELKKMGRTAQQVYRDNETAAERYKRKLDETKASLQGNVNETELVKRATTQLTVEYLKQTDGATKLTAAQKHQLDVKQKLKEQYQHELATLPKLTSETHRLMGEYTQTGVVLTDVTTKKNKLFSAESLAGMSAFATKAAAIAAPFLVVKQAIDAADQRLRQYGGQAITAAKAEGGLAQLAGGDTAKLNALSNASKQSFLEGGFENLGDAHRLTFELESGGILRDRPFLSRLQAGSVDDAAQVAKSTSLVAAGFASAADPTGRLETGNTEALVSKGLAAAGPAPGANLADIEQGVAASAANAKRLGLSDEEDFALVSRIAEVTGSGTEAGTRADALYRAMIRQGYADDPRAKLTAGISKSDMKIAKLKESLAREQSRDAKGKASRRKTFEDRETNSLLKWQAEEAKRAADTDEKLADHNKLLTRAKEDFKRDENSLTRANEDLQHARTVPARRDAQGRVEDAKARLADGGSKRRIADEEANIAEINKKYAPKDFVAKEYKDTEATKTVENLQRNLKKETEARDKLNSQLAATGPRKKMDLGEMLLDIASKGLEQSQLLKYMGRQEAAQAFDVAQNAPAFKQRLTEIKAAQADHLATKVVDSALTLPGVATRKQTLTDQARAQLRLEEKSLQRARIDAEQEDTIAYLQQKLGKIPATMADIGLRGYGFMPGLSTFIPDSWEDPGIRGNRPAPAPSGGVSMDEVTKQLEDNNRIQTQQLVVQQQLVTLFSMLRFGGGDGMVSD